MEILKEFTKFGFSDDYKKETWSQVKEISPFELNENWEFCLKGNQKSASQSSFLFDIKII